jgi:hypothetical protein
VTVATCLYHTQHLCPSLVDEALFLLWVYLYVHLKYYLFIQFHIVSTVQFDNNSQFKKTTNALYYQVLFNIPYICFGSS